MDCQLCAGSHDPKPCPQSRTGQMLGDKYALGPLLGVGGIAAVYAAEHPVLARPIAVKILHKRYAKDHELAQRFVREARETAALGHPAFVKIYDAGVHDGCAFIEMDRLEGRELYELREAEGKLEPIRVARLALAILDALAALHARGVVHRDLKTQNVYVVTSEAGEQIKLLDLGFAKVDDQLMLTSKDHILGTPFYISPEQYNDPHSVDHRADLFSLGIVMFELLTGDWPYQWNNKRDLLAKVMKGQLERHPIELRPDIPKWLDAVIAKALAHKRDERFADALDMKAAIEEGMRDKPGLFGRLFK